VHTLFSVDESLYQRWQADLLAYSHHSVHQAGPLTRLWSGTGRPSPFAGRTFRTVAYSPHPVTCDPYPPYTRPNSIRAWLRGTPLVDEALLLLDPDCVFITPVRVAVSRGLPCAQPVSYLDPAHNRELVRRHCRRPSQVQGVGIPILIYRDDLAQLVVRWIHKTESIRDDRRSQELAGWIAEMWGYVFAAAELGLRHAVRALARFQTEDRADRPIIHYCYSSSDEAGQWAWDKRTYRPWKRVPEPPATTPLSSRRLIHLLNEYAALQNYRVLRRPYSQRRLR
jgi:hypothetical protein